MTIAMMPARPILGLRAWVARNRYRSGKSMSSDAIATRMPPTAWAATWSPIQFTCCARMPGGRSRPASESLSAGSRVMTSPESLGNWLLTMVLAMPPPSVAAPAAIAATAGAAALLLLAREGSLWRDVGHQRSGAQRCGAGTGPAV